MVVASASVSDLVDVLREHQLLEPAQLREVTHGLLPETAEAPALIDKLLQRGWLTPYQAEHLLRGEPRELVLGPYRLLAPLGEGGMGQVFKAVHQRLGRVVALKIIRTERVSQHPEAVPRFQREARAAAQLSHPNVVILYDADQLDGRHFIAMEYVEGTDLSKLVQQYGPLRAEQACDYIRQAALGLQHAHERGMVHRDIKPSNLLLSHPSPRSTPSGRGSSFYGRPPLANGSTRGPAPAAPAVAGGPPPGGVVKILDMGLARMISADGAEAETGLTREGLLMGTPDFIAPEQARNSHTVDIRADLYSLGCTLYYLLVGHAPFSGGTTVEKLLMHQLDEPEPLDRLRPGVPPLVVAVVRKLMAKKPEDRFQAPAEVAEVLASAPAAAPTAAAPAPVRAQTAPAPADDGSRTRVIAVTATPPPAQQVETPADPGTAKKIAVLKGHRGWVLSLSFSDDRNVLASGGVDQTVRLWDFNGHRPREVTLPRVHPGDVGSLAFAPGNRVLASGSGTLDGGICLWELSGEPQPVAALAARNHPVDSLAFAPDGQVLASGGGPYVRLWDVAQSRSKERGTLKGHTGHVKAVAFSPDGRTVASASLDGTVRLWPTSWRMWPKELAVIEGHRGEVHTVAFSPDGRTLASGGMDQAVRLWDLTGPEPRPLPLLQGHKTLVRAVLFPDQGGRLVSVAADGVAILWDLPSGTLLGEWTLPGALLSSVCLTRDGRYLASANSDGHVLVFRLGGREKR
jgi:serine/threonine-protein kinase